MYTGLRTSPRLLAWLIPLLLAACGGGGGGGGNSAPSPTTGTPKPPEQPSSAANASKVGIIDSGLSPDRSEINYANVHFASYVGGGSGLNDNQGINGHGTVVALTLLGLSSSSALYVAQGSQNNLFNYDDTERAVNGLLSQGVRVFNMSFASTERLTTAQALTDAQPRYQVLVQSLRAIAAADGLAVVITGNGGTSTPSPNAQLPLIYQESTLQKNMLAVTGVMDSTSYDTANRAPLTGPFDACGNAAAWCLSAPGYTDYRFQNTDGSGSNVRSYGTSFAAPRAAAAASQVLQRFPWMSGYNLQQTLLTTASYRSDAYANVADSANGRPYNDTFGWGDLNQAKALNGPAMFWADDFHASLDGGRYQFANAISGDHGLVLDGTERGGVLQLTANNSYLGQTRVAANTLLIAGAIAGSASVSGSGTLGGSGVIGGNLLNQGSVNGGLQVQGDYQQGSNGALNIALDSPLRVAGHSTLDGTLNLAPPSSAYVVKQQETLLTSDAGVSGQFSQVNTGVFLEGSVSYNATSVSGQLTRKNTAATAAALGLSAASTQQTAANLEQAFSVADNWQQQGSLSRSQQSALGAAGAFQTLADASSAQSAINSLSGQAHASSNAVLFNALDYQTRLLSNRIADASADKRYGFWLESGQLRGSLNQDGYLGSDYRNTLTALGVDSDLGISGLRVGVAWTQNQIDSTYDQTGGTSRNRLQGAMLYGRYDLTQAWYLQGNLSYQHGRDELKRLVLLDEAAPVSSTTSSNSWQAALQSGYRWMIEDNYRLEPYLGWRETGLETGAFTDKGSAFGLSGDGDSYHRSVGYSGLNLSARQDWSANWWSMLSLYGEYQYALNNPSMDVSARWSGFGAEQNSFQITGMQLDRRSQWLGVRLDVVQAARARLFLRADQHFADRGDEKVLRGGVDVSF
ncbi:autotransporter domain-containing protein [Pantoea sp. BIGb0393]|uniref:Autotransporter domain-containing protein n=1 Tax=Pantoea nemavictus TaxID=2726955 RepID=A0ABU8PPK7_9GAMM|nr:autotransporter domain-containing protein [Pantoea nemavictus]MBA0035684.1 autotransporter domain-containing protein [Pantoea nemavictus]